MPGIVETIVASLGNSFRSREPRFPTDDANYRIIQRYRVRFLHYYFYIRDPGDRTDGDVRGHLVSVSDHLLSERPPFHRN
jgi:hypothetical protein